ncbi:TatD family hydrolase [Candidatus Pelagibacter sp.]|nr:TatD family hydrolase [Candidatus Pelagibacter sp.]
MIDSHCHLDHEPLYSNLSDVIKRSKQIGLKKILTISTNLNSFENIKKIIELDEMIYGSIGIHPHETSDDRMEKEFIIDNANKYKKIIGVGETGLDFYYENSKRDNQIKSFIEHIEASIVLKYPLIVHSRSAEKETFDILNNYKNSDVKILMHCFTGSREFAKKMMSLNAYFSASGIITFKNSIELQETFKLIEKDKILIETDSPFLAPVPMRGKKNEPSYIKYTLQKLSELKSLNFDDLEEITNNNFEKLFS